ncbi:hypothetical protein DW1_1134 [Proteiniborus sp. DW1]|uniref:hypothetical protein n=1 Tax=Proteiniborus sp. DW1 TaxID=1889883 RepID=UPI00092DEBDA|nr:hypothetical protein [Proteiniborus sp. DW1]SCG82707.1 hypothetical protein DW1_1134 [Proteiniborus sp. DW1]
MPHISYIDTAVPNVKVGTMLKIEIDNEDKKRKTCMRVGKVIQRTKDLIIVDFAYLKGNGSFRRSYRVMDLAGKLVKWEVIE